MGVIVKVLLMLGFVLSAGLVAGEHYRERKWVARITGALAIILGIAGVWGLFGDGIARIGSLLERTGNPPPGTHQAHAKPRSPAPVAASAPSNSGTSNPAPSSVAPVRPDGRTPKRTEPAGHQVRPSSLAPGEQLASANYELLTIGKHIYFEIDSARIDIPGVRTARAWAALLRKYPAVRGTLGADDRQNFPVKLVGTTVTLPRLAPEDSPTPNGLVTIGVRRVTAVKQMLAGFDVPLYRLTTNVNVNGVLEPNGPAPGEIIPVDQSVTLTLSLAGQ